MAEEILLKVDLDEQKSFADLEKLKLSLIRLQDERKKLNESIKKGVITEEEYAKELVRVEQLMKSNQTAYNNLTKSVQGHKSKTDELIKSNKDLALSIQDAAKNINVMGVNLGGMLETIASPQTGALALVGALATAYATSAAGARDLESAQASLGANFTFLSNQLASLAGADGKGGGILSRLADQFNLFFFGAGGVARGAIAATATNALKELELAEIESKRVAKNALDEAEKLRRVRDNQQESFNNRLTAAKGVLGEIDEREAALLETQQKRLFNLQLLLSNDKDNLDLQKEIKKVTFEIADIQEDSQGKRTEALNGINNLLKEQNDLLNKNAESALMASIKAEEASQKKQAADEKELNGLIDNIEKRNQADQAYIDSLIAGLSIKDDIGDAEIRQSNRLTDQILRNSETRKQGYQTEVEAFATLTNESLRLASKFGDQSKAATLTQLGLDTALAVSALVRYSEQNPLNGPTGGAAGIATFAAGIIRIGANIAQAYQLAGGSAPGLSAKGSSKTADQVKAALGYSDEQLAQLGLVVTNDGRVVSQASVNRNRNLGIGGFINPLLGIRNLIRGIGGLFHEGGYTGPGSVMQPAGIVHAGEVVWNQRDVASVGGPHVANAMRPTYKGYNDGGLVTNTMASKQMNVSMPDITVYTIWKELKDFDQKMAIKAQFTER